MFMQNPVFIPGPTNIPEILRKAVDMPTVDHRSSLFGEVLRPALAGVKKVVQTKSGSALFSIYRDGRIGDGDYKYAKLRRSCSRCSQRHVQPALD
jgi:hypothetical protein